jgi:hypothetical protein
MPVLVRVALSLILIVAVVTTAAAECAWVLWETVDYRAERRQEIRPLKAYDDRAACERDRVALRERNASAPVPFFFTCFPDTIDPRGAKR